MKFVYIFSFLLYTIPVFATPVTPYVALKRLQGKNMSRVRGSLQTPHFQISKIMTDSCGNNTVYLFDSKSLFKNKCE
jgi:hypothetical protein